MSDLNLVPGINSQDCQECAEKAKRIKDHESLQTKYEQMNRDLTAEIASLRETIESLHKQNSMQVSTNEELNKSLMVLSKSTMPQKDKNELFLSTVSRRTVNTKETSNLAQELLQKNLALEETNKRLRFKVSRLNKELYDNEKVFGTRLELVYTALRNYIV
jgi:hypothetical protein